ncbi:MAG: hypothetical protein Q8N80_05440 [Candidatus Omnitrophota bacterium]|nr:hypothetical protein [Candidatus Omnitrophota bacterium]
MRKYLGFLKCSSVVIKVAAWIFLFFGIVGSASLFLGKVPGNPRWLGAVILVFYTFMFFFFFFVAKIADILVKIINAIQKD